MYSGKCRVLIWKTGPMISVSVARMIRKKATACSAPKRPSLIRAATSPTPAAIISRIGW